MNLFLNVLIVKLIEDEVLVRFLILKGVLLLVEFFNVIYIRFFFINFCVFIL